MEHRKSEHDSMYFRIRQPLLFLVIKFILIESFFTFIFWEIFPVFFGKARIAIFLLFKIVEGFILLWLVLSWFQRRYKVEPNKIIAISGIFVTTEKVYFIRNIESVALQQSLLGKLLNYGTIQLQAPTLQEFVLLKNVYHPALNLERIESLIQKAKDRTNAPMTIEKMNMKNIDVAMDVMA